MLRGSLEPKQISTVANAGLRCRPGRLAQGVFRILRLCLGSASACNHVFDMDQVQEIITKICEFVVRESELEVAAVSLDPIQLASLRQIALYLNKHLPNSRLEIANDLLAKCHRSLTLTGKHIWVRLIFTITKALVLRLAPNSDAIFVRAAGRRPVDHLVINLKHQMRHNPLVLQGLHHAVVEFKEVGIEAREIRLLLVPPRQT